MKINQFIVGSSVFALSVLASIQSVYAGVSVQTLSGYVELLKDSEVILNVEGVPVPQVSVGLLRAVLLELNPHAGVASGSARDPYSRLLRRLDQMACFISMQDSGDAGKCLIEIEGGKTCEFVHGDLVSGFERVAGVARNLFEEQGEFSEELRKFAKLIQMRKSGAVSPYCAVPSPSFPSSRSATPGFGVSYDSATPRISPALERTRRDSQITLESCLDFVRPSPVRSRASAGSPKSPLNSATQQ